MRIPKNLKFIRLKGKGRALLASRDIGKGEVIVPLKFESIKSADESSPESLQIDDNKFLDSKHYYASDFINHSCEPVARIDFENMNFVALKDIYEGEEITYHYLTTEYDLAGECLDFDCKCGFKSCLGRVKGFKFLDSGQRLKLAPMLSPYLKKKLPGR